MEAGPPIRAESDDLGRFRRTDDGELMRRLLARAALEHRADDTADIIAQRLALYHEVTSPSWRGTATAESWSRWTRCAPRRRSGANETAWTAAPD
jgi:hypothetical protein